MPSCTFSEPTSDKTFDDDKDVDDDDGHSLDIEAEQAHLDVSFSPGAKDEDGDFEDDDKNSVHFEQAIVYTDKFHCQLMKLDDQVIQQQHFSNFSNNNAEKCVDPKSDRKRTSQLSFGIDRILNQEDVTHQQRNITEEKKGSDSVRLHISSLDSLSPTSTMSGHMLSCSPRKSSSPVSFGAPRIGSVDILPLTSGFHSPFLPAEACRTDSTSLDLLPMRSMWPEVFVCPWTGMQRDRYGLVRRVGHPYQNRTPPKRKKPRTAFTRQQVLELEKRFTRQKYLASAERSALAKTLSMTDAQVKTWFQNRRTKWRRQTAEERDIERQAAHKFLLSLRTDEPARPVGYGTLCGIAPTTSLPRTEDSSIPST